MKIVASQTKAIKNEFNRTAEKLNCKARIGGNARKPEFQEFTGQITDDGYELVIKIDSTRFAQLISKFPQLH